MKQKDTAASQMTDISNTDLELDRMFSLWDITDWIQAAGNHTSIMIPDKI